MRDDVVVPPIPEPSQETTGIGDDSGTSLPEPWDSAPPTVDVGARLTTQTFCALLTDYGAEVTWEYEGIVDGGQSWRLVVTADTPSAVAELEVCVDKGSGDWLYWDSSDSMRILTSGLDHAMSPSVAEGRWFGEVIPLPAFQTPECDAAIASIGLSWPVAMSLQVVNIEAPPSTGGS